MNTKPFLCGAALIEIERSRYDDLVHKERELEILKNVLEVTADYSSVDTIKKYFLKAESEVKTND